MHKALWISNPWYLPCIWSLGAERDESGKFLPPDPVQYAIK